VQLDRFDGISLNVRYAISFRCGPLAAMQAAMIFPFVRLTTINMDLTKPDQVSPISSTNSDSWSTWASWAYDVRRRETTWVFQHSIAVAAVLRGQIKPDHPVLMALNRRWSRSRHTREWIVQNSRTVKKLFLFLFYNTKHSALCVTQLDSSVWSLHSSGSSHWLGNAMHRQLSGHS
jgi:hypothetical protein